MMQSPEEAEAAGSAQRRPPAAQEVELLHIVHLFRHWDSTLKQKSREWGMHGAGQRKEKLAQRARC